MITQDKIPINITVRNVTYFKEMGYDAIINNQLIINISDLKRYSRVKIPIKCSNCGTEKEMTYTKYMDNVERYGFYTCKKCSTIKKKITFTNNYGVDNPMKVDKIKQKGKTTKKKKYGDENYNNQDKHKQTNLKLFGVEHHLQNKDILEKQKQTNLEIYGFEHASQSKIIKDKISYSYNKSKLKRTNDLYKKNHNINILEINGEYFTLLCDKCNTKYKIKGNVLQLRLLYNNELCTNCNPVGINNVSQPEKKLLSFIEDNYDGKIIINSKSIIPPYELDIYLPELNLAFEFNGLYWHNELNKDKDYHKMKSDLCESKGIQVIHIWEDDWDYKRPIVKSMILNKLGKSKNRIYGRKTEIREIIDNSLVRDFLNDNHVQGFVGSLIKIGLFYDDELVSLMTFGKLRKMMNLKSGDNKYELIRFCNKLNTNVLGGASKLFSYFIKKYTPEYISSYADRSYSNGNLYKQLEFKLDSLTPPNHYYIVDNIRKHRFNYRKSNLIKQGYDSTKTAKDIMFERKIYKIYNSGNYKFIYTFH